MELEEQLTLTHECSNTDEGERKRETKPECLVSAEFSDEPELYANLQQINSKIIWLFEAHQ